MVLKDDEFMRCPKCGGKEFLATAHVTQDWGLDESGAFQECLNECVEVTHSPDMDDIWTCKRCGHSAVGSEFVTTKSRKRKGGDQ